ncbi:MAG: hypothetical protein HY819_00240 [Acidobacteria bacterium]|nr:hypothetical protein [Acidobacteriota bacterium]
MKKVSILVIFVCICIATMMVNNVDVNAANKCEIKFMFDGLQAIAFGNPDKVTDGILDVHHHTPKLEIKEILKGKEKVIFTAEGKDLYKKVLNISMPNNPHKPTRYYSPDMNKDTSDFRWCLDIENDLFQKQLYLKEDKLYYKINFQVGEFLANGLTEEKYQFVAGSKIHSFNRQIGEPSAKVQLQEGNKLVINGLNQVITLPYQLGSTYQVNITNLPPKEMANIDHFAFYYDAIKTNTTQFMPLVSKKVAFSPRPYMCGALVFGKSEIK